ncbi:hypothetical protein PPERSA_09501 [Pseudocohnilembus persalinus]|uniref:Uncharacterized protein n=1 Tax=Pseudocohnilembus persalinus TaxID=266149 RepID=A0A0V0QFB1_PSEPJ|nr:hypothetical protein PPERSA_09501 [Pseudocohnilembus persalinus]|eukprot:KRX00895.1 hypothetical protein PPERSA_09501 [Pseudocohnilembus persalinus]
MKFFNLYDKYDCPFDVDHKIFKADGYQQFINHIKNCTTYHKLKQKQSLPLNNKSQIALYFCKFNYLHIFNSQDQRDFHQKSCQCQSLYFQNNSQKRDFLLINNKNMLNFDFNEEFDPVLQNLQENFGIYIVEKEILKIHCIQNDSMQLISFLENECQQNHQINAQLVQKLNNGKTKQKFIEKKIDQLNKITNEL